MKTDRPVQILLVEDNPDDVMITLRALSSSKVESKLHVVRDGQEALDFVLHADPLDLETPRPDLVVLDINLPRMDGLEVLSRIRANAATSLMPVIMLTASSRPEDIADSYMRGANTYIQKPVEFEQFLQAIDVVGQYWSQIATHPPEDIGSDDDALSSPTSQGEGDASATPVAPEHDPANIVERAQTYLAHENNERS